MDVMEERVNMIRRMIEKAEDPKKLTWSELVRLVNALRREDE
jgi:hypothetical protein|tara:strand:+ start:68 stop:193 length:126 start_codon:yes stop_codon:yes gene_type:complete